MPPALHLAVVVLRGIGIVAPLVLRVRIQPGEAALSLPGSFAAGKLADAALQLIRPKPFDTFGRLFAFQPVLRARRVVGKWDELVEYGALRRRTGGSEGLVPHGLGC